MALLPTALTGHVGDTIVVKSRAIDGYGLAVTSPTIWTSSDPTVAIVQETLDVRNGALITCLSVGSCTITGSADLVSAEFYLTVIIESPGSAEEIDVLASQSFQPKNKMQ